MYYVYILRSIKDRKLYTGCTNDLKLRLKQHHSGLVDSTKQRKPLTLVHYEAFMNKHYAFAREQWLKTGWGRNYMKKTLSNHLKNLGG